MAESNAIIGFGVDLLKGNADGPPETFTTFGAEITSITLPNISKETIDVTHTTSPDAYREFIAGISDGGEVTMEINFIPSASDIIVAELNAGKKNWQILFPNGVKWTFAAFVTNYSPDSPIDGKLSASVTFKVTGKPVIS